MCRFPLLLHYLEQQENVEIPQWHNWLLDLLTGENLRVMNKLEAPRVSTFIGGVHIGARALLDPKLILQYLATCRHGLRGRG